MLSVLSGHTDCVYSLLNKGANVDAKDKWGRTALHRGVRDPHFQLDYSLRHDTLRTICTSVTNGSTFANGNTLYLSVIRTLK